MATPEDIKGQALGLLDDMHDLGVTEGKASRDDEVAGLEAKVAELEAELAATKVPDYPQVTTEADLKAAVAKSQPVTVAATIPLTSPLKVPTTGATIYLADDGVVLRNFDSPGGATKQSLIINADWTKPIQGLTITGPGKIQAAPGMRGNLIGVWADDIYFRDWSCDLWAGGRLFIGGGERQDVSGITARVAKGAASGAGGWRVAIGSGHISNMDIVSGDDVFQAVPAGGSSDPLRNKGDIHDLTYEDCVGQSYSARLMVCGLQGTGMTTSIRGVTFKNVTGFGGGTGVNIANHAVSSGSITGIKFVACTVDQSQAGDTGQPGDVFVLRDAGTGIVDDIDFSGLRVLNPKRRSPYATKGAVGSNIVLPVVA